VSDVDSEETTEPVEILATVCVVDIGAFTSVNYGQSVTLNTCEASEVAPEVALSEVLNLFKVGGVHR
jgi:hypothetical protein